MKRPAELFSSLRAALSEMREKTPDLGAWVGILVTCALLIYGSSAVPQHMPGKQRPHSTATATADASACANFPTVANFPHVSSTYKPRYTTLARTLLDREASVKIAHITPDMYAAVDSIIDDAKKYLDPYDPQNNLDDDFAKRQINGINCILRSHGFFYPGHSGVSLLSDGLQPISTNDTDWTDELASMNESYTTYLKARPHGPFYIADCDILAYLYLSVADAMHYPIQEARVPRHRFVRWVFASGEIINFEQTGGWFADDDYYVKEFKLDPTDREMGKILTMSRDYTLADYDGILGYEFLEKRQFADSEKMLRASVQRVSTDTMWMTVLADMFALNPGAVNRKHDTLQLARRVVQLNPVPENRDTLACVLAVGGDFPAALKEERRAVRGGKYHSRKLATHLLEIRNHLHCGSGKYDNEDDFHPGTVGEVL